MLYDFYLGKQVLMDKFDMILKKLYRMPGAELSVDEGAKSGLFSLFHQFESFHLPNQLDPRLMKQVQNVLDMLLLAILFSHRKT